MIRRLRQRFILSSMLALFLVLAVIMIAMNGINYYNVVADADTLLGLLQESGGFFAPEPPEDMPDEPPGEPPEGMWALWGRGQDDGSVWRLDDGWKKGLGGRLESPELPFETRYFIVTLDESGQVTRTDLGRIAAVDEETAAEMAAAVGRRTRGFLQDYRFAQEDTEDGRQIIFVDCGLNMSAFRSFLLTSGLISLAGMAAVFALILLFSRKITRPAAESYEKQKRFITDAGHELKTPLAIIRADADVLSMDIGEDNEWLADIQYQTTRMAELTGDLVQLSRMEETDSASFVEFSLSDAVRETAESFQASARAQGKSYRYTVADSLRLRGEEKAIRRLVSILLDNAVKYSDEGGSILLTLKKQGRNAVLTCYNTAECVKREDIGHLFERFYRSEKSRNSEKGGSGIGLSIAQAVVQAHKGRISAATDNEKSLRVTAELPM